MPELLTKGDIAKMARLTGQGITYAVERGELKPVARTGSGILLFDPRDVEKYLDSRKRGKTEEAQ